MLVKGADVYSFILGALYCISPTYNDEQVQYKSDISNINQVFKHQVFSSRVSIEITLHRVFLFS